MNPDDPVVRTAVFGRMVEDFLETELGQYIVRRAEEQAEQAMDKLKTVSVWRTNRIRQLQNEIMVAESIQQWLADAVIDGNQALKLLEDE